MGSILSERKIEESPTLCILSSQAPQITQLMSKNFKMAFNN